MENVIIEFEGNIGSGKSSLIRAMQKSMDTDGIDCAAQMERANETFLSAFYDDPKAFGFAFQMYMLTTRLYHLQEARRLASEQDYVVLLDRGAVGDTLFAHLGHKNQLLGDREIAIYQDECKRRMNQQSISSGVDILVYLHVHPAECWRRATKLRGNDSEKRIPLAYFESVDDEYFSMLLYFLAAGDRSSVPQPLKDRFANYNFGPAPKALVLDWNKFGSTEDVIDQVIDLHRGKRNAPLVHYTRDVGVLCDFYMLESSFAEGAYDQDFKDMVMQRLCRAQHLTIYIGPKHS